MATLNQKPTSSTFEEVQKKYDQERLRRYRADGAAQFVDTTRSPKFRNYAADPWYDHDKHPRGRQDVPETLQTGFLIAGAGFGALLFAARLIESGISASEITLVDAANGYGGAWYWNRYPGLMCDVESSIYMPLLEETGYIPKHRYSYGTELRQYAESVAQKYGLEPTTLFRSTMKTAKWDESRDEWACSLSKKGVDGTSSDITVRANFVVLAAGILVHPKLPLIPGLEEFDGHTFHTSRWDYGYTGGSPESPELVNLKDKKVAIIGTGATAIQVVPELVKWAGQLNVFQRTASSVDTRDQRPIDPVKFRSTCSGKAWQSERRENFTAFTSNTPEKPVINLVDDSWTRMPSYSGLVGCPVIKELPLEKTGDYIASLHAIDFPRQERIRARVDEVVKDKEVAEGLKPWYPGWCKRPCFHDEYLPAFNNQNVHLVDTRGRGVDRLTKDGLYFDGKHYKADVIIFSTGFEPWTSGSPAHRAGMKITGRDGLDMDLKWRDNLGTFQGIFTRNFPNLILPGGTQAAPAVNQVHMMDVYARHVAKLIKLGKDGVGRRAKFVIEPTEEGEAEWVRKIVSMAHGVATLINCTPSYVTNEEKLSLTSDPEEQLARARRAPWTPGLLDYTREIESWFAEGRLQGLEVKAGLAEDKLLLDALS